MSPGTYTPTPPQTGQTSNGMPVPAGANMINQLLTTPRPGGMPGMNIQGGQTAPTVDQYGNPVTAANPLTGTPNAAATTTAAPAPAAAQVVGGGIAGVASKREQEGIKIYNEKKKYNEWEFVYDITKDKSRSGAMVAAPAPAAGAAPSGQQPQTQPPQTPLQPQQQMQPQQPALPVTPPPSQ